MNEEFNDRLKSRITDVFDNFEDDSAQQGWLLLRKNYPEKQKRRGIIWFWWGSVAAILFIALGLGIWLNSGSNVKSTIVKNPQPAIKVSHSSVNITSPASKPIHQNNTLAANDHSKTNTDKVTDESTPVQKTKIAGLANHAKSNQNTASANSRHYVAKNTTNTYRDKHNNDKPFTQETAPQANIKPVPTQTLANNMNAADQAIKNGSDSAKLANNTNNTKPETKPVEAIKPIVKQPEHPIFTAQKPNEVKAPKQVDPKIKYGIYAATYFNYAKGSDNEFNVGAGLMAEIKLVGNLKLLTGIALNQNSLNYQTDLPQKANTYLAYSLSQPTKGLKDAALYTASGGAAFTTVASSPALQNYQASLFALDIPLNLKYQFTKNDTYIAAGVSSGTYVYESYNFVYNYPSAIIKTTDQSTKTQHILNTFDFARTLNLSFGTGFPLGKSNRLIVEPFLKYPLDGLGSQDLKFGAGGVNLKINFPTSKK